MEAEASQRFIDAGHRAERGDYVQERHYAFENWETLSRVLTGKRMDMLRYICRNRVTSIRALAISLGRDYKNVHADVRALKGAGLMDAGHGGLCANYDAIETKIAI